MAREECLPGHFAVIGRADRGQRRYATTVACSCGTWAGREIQKSPSGGGAAMAAQAHHAHVLDAISRDPLATAQRAHAGWLDWQPGDGTTYRVRICTMQGGPDYGDRILLVSVNRKVWAFQYPVADYRRREMGSPGYRRSVFRGSAGDLWPVVEPLLVIEGVVDAQQE